MLRIRWSEPYGTVRGVSTSHEAPHGPGARSDAGPDRLGTTSYVVLGLLAVHGPMTAYELKTRVAGSVGYFWPFPHSQLYGEPVRLAALGLVVEDQEAGGRRRRRFSVTDLGRRAVADWVAEPVQAHPQIRDLGLLKLYLGDLVPPERMAALAGDQERAHRERLSVYEGIDTTLRSVGPPARHQHATLRLGLAYERAAAAFWAEIGAEWRTSNGDPDGDPDGDPGR